MESVLWKVLAVIGTVFLGYLSFSDFLFKRKSRDSQHSKDQQSAHSELELKVKALEGRIETQYGELSTRLSGMERSLSETKNANFIFETRIIGSVEKLDSKLDRLQDLFVQIKLKQ